MARKLRPIEILGGEIPAEDAATEQAPSVTLAPVANPPQGVGEETEHSGQDLAGEGDLPDESPSEPSASPFTHADFAGHLEHVALFLPPSLWQYYDDLALKLSHTLGRRISNNHLILSVLAVRCPADIEEARTLVRRWLEARGFEDDPYGHEAGIQRNLRLYPGQRGHLDRLAQQLRRSRVTGARSKLLCAVLHFRKPAEQEAIPLLREAQALTAVL